MLALYYTQLVKNSKAGECSALSIPDIYIKFPVMRPNKKGKLVKKQEYTKVAAVAVIRLPEDIENPVLDLANPDEKVAHFKVLI